VTELYQDIEQTVYVLKKHVKNTQAFYCLKIKISYKMKFTYLFASLFVLEYSVTWPCKVVSFVKESYFICESILLLNDNHAFECNCC
jgi:hypothetical protein